MIVVAIIGILAAIAIPAYQDYTIRAQVTEGLNLPLGRKASVSEFFQKGRAPADRIAAGGCAATRRQNVGQLRDAAGVVTALITGDLQQHVLQRRTQDAGLDGSRWCLHQRRHSTCVDQCRVTAFCARARAGAGMPRSPRMRWHGSAKYAPAECRA